VKKSNKLSASLEDYLKTIKILCDDKGFARVKEISKKLNVEMPSVTLAIKSLKKKGLILQEKYGYAELTPNGNKVSEKICNRYKKIKKFLEKVLNIDPRIAKEEACKIEHLIKPHTFNRITSFLNYLNEYPEIGNSILESFKLFLEIESKTKNKNTKGDD